MSGRVTKWRRRRPGIYLARTRVHGGRRYENGYVGMSNHLDRRQAEHEGRGRYGAPAKPWIDLEPRWFRLPLPWWMGFSWVLLPIEYVAIKVLLPRYNVTHNLTNPRRVTPYEQKRQRLERDGQRRRMWSHRDRRHVTY